MSLSQVGAKGWDEGLHRKGRGPKRMREAVFAVIHRVPERVTPGMLRVAGRPVIEWQIEWLLGMGVDGVIVEVGDDAASVEVAEWVGTRYGEGTDVIVVAGEDATRLGAREAACRAGIGALRPILAIPADMIGNGDLTYMVPVPNPFGVVAFFDVPPALVRKVSGGTVRLMRAPLGVAGAASKKRGQPTPVHGPGWAVRVKSADDAVAVTSAARRGDLPGIDVDAIPSEAPKRVA